MILYGYHCRAARAWLNWTQADLAKAAEVGLTAVKDFENGRRNTIIAIRNQIASAFAKEEIYFDPWGITDMRLKKDEC